MRSVPPRGNHPTPFAPSAQSCLAHQPGHPFAREAPSLVAQLDLNTWTPVSLLMVLKDLSNMGGELSIFSPALTGRALAPGVKAAFRDFQDLTHDDDGKFLLVLFNKLVLHLDSREKMLTTFFRMSRSCCTLSSSRLRRRFSSSSGV